MFYPVPLDMTIVPARARVLGRPGESDVIAEFRCDLEEDEFYAKVSVTEAGAEVCVYESAFDDEYLPFSANVSQGAFVGAIRTQVEDIVSGIWERVCELTDARAIVVDYMAKRYGTVPESPWESYPEHQTFKTEVKGKWYAIVMSVHASKLGFERDETMNVMNVKIAPDDIPNTLDGEHILPAYHMNKKHWISVVLDRDLDINRAKELIDASHELVEPRQRKD